MSSCLTSVLNSSYPDFEVILVDNGSKDGSVELIENMFRSDRRLKILKLRKNIGFAAGNNVGIAHCTGNYIVFLNNDTIVEKNWLCELVKIMEKNNDIGAVQSKLLKMDNPKILDSAGDFVDYYGSVYSRGKGENETHYDQLDKIFSARGAAMMVKSNVLKEVGSFDPTFFMIYEDVDLCWRINLKGYKIFYVPKSIVYHFSEATTVKLNNKFPLFHRTKNWLMLMLKNRELKALIRYNPLISLLGTMTLDLLKRRDPESLLTRLRAVVWVIQNLPQIWSKRLFIQKILKTAQSTENRLLIKNDFASLTKSITF